MRGNLQDLLADDGLSESLRAMVAESLERAAREDAGLCACKPGKYLCRKHTPAFYKEYARLAAGNLPWPGGVDGVLARIRAEE